MLWKLAGFLSIALALLSAAMAAVLGTPWGFFGAWSTMLFVVPLSVAVALSASGAAMLGLEGPWKWVLAVGLPAFICALSIWNLYRLSRQLAITFQ